MDVNPKHPSENQWITQGQIVVGTIRRGGHPCDPRDPNCPHEPLRVDLGFVEAILPFLAQVPGEIYDDGMTLPVYVERVDLRREEPPQVVVSRSHPDLVRELFAQEMSEITDGIVEIKSVARQEGIHSKIAVLPMAWNESTEEDIMEEARLRAGAVMSELNGERIDIVEWSIDPAEYVSRALFPAKVSSVSLDSAMGVVVASVPPDQLNLAIGEDGENARLAARLTGIRINIVADPLAD